MLIICIKFSLIADINLAIFWQNKPASNLFSAAVGIKQKKMVNEMVQKVSLITF